MQLMINANTVAKAYNELTAQGLIISRQGLGLFVAAPRQMLSDEEQRKQLSEAIEGFVNEIAYLDFEQKQILEQVELALGRLSNKHVNKGD